MTKNLQISSQKTLSDPIEKTKLGAVPSWDLSDFYISSQDPKITKEFKKIGDEINKFEKNFQGRVKKLKDEELFLAIKNYETICEQIGKIGSYSYLLYVSDLSNQANIAFYQNNCEKISKLESQLIFFVLELNEIDEKELQRMCDQSPQSKSQLAKFQPFLRDCRIFKKHQLSKELEKFALEKNITSRAAFVRLFDETINNLKFRFGKKNLNSQEIFNFLCNSKQETRRSAAKSISKVFAENIKIFTFITNILAKDKAIEDAYRGYKTPISSRNLGNFVEDEIVDLLVLKVKENYESISHRYYKIKAKMLGQKFLNYYDRNAPLAKNDEKIIRWQEAKELVLEAYGEFHPNLRKIGQQFFDKNWIDAKVANGKDSGAFSHPCVPSVHPYILMNFQGKVRDVMTLAHELGHGIHQFLAAKQGYLQAQTPLTLAETASVFGEQLTFQKILANETNDKKRSLIIASKVEDMINTVIRQIAFLDFERKIHDERKNGEIAMEKICEFWLEVQKESLGSAFKFGKEYRFFWCYIPHFIHSPFYVYSYGFGDCLVNALYGIYKSQNTKILKQEFSEKYLKMLESGGALHHKELLAPFGLSIAKPEFWQSGLDVIISLIDQLEASL